MTETTQRSVSNTLEIDFHTTQRYAMKRAYWYPYFVLEPFSAQSFGYSFRARIWIVSSVLMCGFFSPIVKDDPQEYLISEVRTSTRLSISQSCYSYVSSYDASTPLNYPGFWVGLLSTNLQWDFVMAQFRALASLRASELDTRAVRLSASNPLSRNLRVILCCYCVTSNGSDLFNLCLNDFRVVICLLATVFPFWLSWSCLFNQKGEYSAKHK
jgi:hypothetical protein